MQNENDKLLKQSLRQKYSADGLSALTEKEIMQLILTYSSGGDYEKTAELLSENYSSLTALIDADVHTLIKRTGLDEKTVVLLKLIPQLSRVYFMENRKIKKLADTTEAVKFFENYFIGALEEQLAVVCTNEKLEIKALITIASGTAVSVSSSCREIADFALRNNAVYVFVAHNHPMGDATPSAGDYRSTDVIFRTLDKLGIILADHIVIGKGSAVSMRELPYTLEFKQIITEGYSLNYNPNNAVIK